MGASDTAKSQGQNGSVAINIPPPGDDHKSDRERQANMVRALTQVEGSKLAWRRAVLRRLQSEGVSLVIVSGSVEPVLLAEAEHSSLAILPHCPGRLIEAAARASGAELVYDVLELNERDVGWKAQTVTIVDSGTKLPVVCFLPSNSLPWSSGWMGDDEGDFLLPRSARTRGVAHPDPYLAIFPYPVSHTTTHDGQDKQTKTNQATAAAQKMYQAHQNRGPNQDKTRWQENEAARLVPVTLVLCGPTSVACAELEQCVFRILSRVRNAAENGHVLPGAGLTEAVCAAALTVHSAQCRETASRCQERKVTPSNSTRNPSQPWVDQDKEEEESDDDDSDDDDETSQLIIRSLIGEGVAEALRGMVELVALNRGWQDKDLQRAIEKVSEA